MLRKQFLLLAVNLNLMLKELYRRVRRVRRVRKRELQNFSVYISAPVLQDGTDSQAGLSFRRRQVFSELAEF